MENWPQWFIVFADIMAVIISIARHGRPKGEYNGVATFCAFLITMFLYYQGGFFDCWLTK